MQHIHQNILCYRPRKNIRENNKFTTFVSFLQFIYFWGNKFPVAAFSILSPIQWSGQPEPSRNMGDRCLLSVDIKPQLTDKNIFPLFLLAFISRHMMTHSQCGDIWLSGVNVEFCQRTIGHIVNIISNNIQVLHWRACAKSSRWISFLDRLG